MDSGILTFDIKTGMKNIIGRDLITDDFIAIYELVKNSYDAYASYVQITFDDDEIVIADNGKGMSKSDLVEKWFAVAYSAKKDGTEDDETRRESKHLNNLKSRRFYAGAKGVGRFSCDRLGDGLTLKTSKYDGLQAYSLEINWSDFEKDAKQSFNSVEIPYTEIHQNCMFPQGKNHGTILKIRRLNSEWTENRLIELKRSLEKLINPFSNDITFQIEIIAPSFVNSDNEKIRLGENSKVINGLISNGILKVLDLKTTQISVIIEDRLISTKIIDRGNLIYHIEEPNIDKNIIDDLNINLYFLNRSAKINFGKLMDIAPVNYGNVFLFKNGFRVQPYGDVGDDSWKIDNRKQQGYNRFLGTRDLFGKVELVTENYQEFKEVSSRDGGLVETLGKIKLFSLFYEKALKRLERYVVGVLWGEGFIRRNYFFDTNIAQKYRNELDEDKDKDSYEDIVKNIGSKIDFVNLIKTLSDDDNVKIIYCNKDLLNLVNEKLDVVQPRFFAELEKIAEKTSDNDLINQIKLTEDNFDRIVKEKENALLREEEERKRRIEAEKKAEEEQLRRIAAEKKQKEEEGRRRVAELEAERKEKEKILAELAQLKAEKKAKEEEEKNKDLSDKLSIESKKNQYLNATRKTLSDDAEQLVHSIDLYVGNASTYVNELLGSNTLDRETKDKVYSIKNNIDRALKVSQIIIKSNFDYKHINQRVNIPIYMKEYLEDISLSRKDLDIRIGEVINKYALINPIDIDIILDNLISNSVKAKAKRVLVEFGLADNKLEIFYYDDGIGMPEKLANNPDAIFELGVRESSEKGSGIGMYDVRKRINNIKGTISFIGNKMKLTGAGFKIQI